MLCLDGDPYKRIDKIPLMNHTYILQHHTPQEVVAHNRILVSNYQRIFDIYSSEVFVEAILAYFSIQINIKKQVEKLLKELKNIDPERLVFMPIENLEMAFKNYFGDEMTYKLHFDMVKY